MTEASYTNIILASLSFLESQGSKSILARDSETAGALASRIQPLQKIATKELEPSPELFSQAHGWLRLEISRLQDEIERLLRKGSEGGTRLASLRDTLAERIQDQQWLGAALTRAVAVSDY